MTHPATFYIRSLFVLEDDLSDKAINAKLGLLGLASINAVELQKIRTIIPPPPEDFRPWSKTHRISVKYLRDLRIYSIVHPDEAHVEMREEILNRPRLREDVERLILGNVKPQEASYRLQKLKKKVSDIAIAEYKHYFWNPDIMSFQDWSDYFEKDDSRRTKSRTEDLKAVLTVGPELAMYRTGITKELDNKKILMEVQQELYYTFQETRALPVSIKKVEMLSNLACGLARIDERISSGDTAIQQVLKSFEKFKVRQDAGQVDSLFGLAPTGSISQKSRTEIIATNREEKS
jgi:hypothetical protein